MSLFLLCVSRNVHSFEVWNITYPIRAYRGSNTPPKHVSINKWVFHWINILHGVRRVNIRQNSFGYSRLNLGWLLLGFICRDWGTSNVTALLCIILGTLVYLLNQFRHLIYAVSLDIRQFIWLITIEFGLIKLYMFILWVSILWGPFINNWLLVLPEYFYQGGPSFVHFIHNYTRISLHWRILQARRHALSLRFLLQYFKREILEWNVVAVWGSTGSDPTLEYTEPLRIPGRVHQRLVWLGLVFGGEGWAWDVLTIWIILLYHFTSPSYSPQARRLTSRAPVSAFPAIRKRLRRFWRAAIAARIEIGFRYGARIWQTLSILSCQDLASSRTLYIRERVMHVCDFWLVLSKQKYFQIWLNLILI